MNSGDGSTSATFWHLQNSFINNNNNNYEDDDLDYSSSGNARLRSTSHHHSHRKQKLFHDNVFNSRAVSDLDTFESTKSTSKMNIRHHHHSHQKRIYLTNLTVNAGESVRLQCPYEHPEVSSSSSSTNAEQYFSTKTVG